MLKILRALFRGGAARQTAQATRWQPRKPAPAQAPGGFGVPRDTILSGWFNTETGELFRGFAIRPNDVILDAGCGDAPFIRFCARQGAAVIFADIDTAKVHATCQALKGARARQITPIVSNCDPLPLKSETVDKVISLEVLEHVDDPKSFMAELARVGKPGAQYLVTVPDSGLEKFQKKGLAPDNYFEKPNHIRIFEQEDFSRLVAGAGLEIETQDRFGFYWSMWWVFFWACRQEISPPWHPLLQSWTATWSQLLDTQDGPRIKRALDDLMPKTQLIIARKPF